LKCQTGRFIRSVAEQTMVNQCLGVDDECCPEVTGSPSED